MESLNSEFGAVTIHYRVGPLSFNLLFESLWRPMPYSDQVRMRIKAAASGLSLADLLPIRAGDKEPRRSFVQRKEELLPGLEPNMLDLSPLEPFRTEPSYKPSFSLTIHTPTESPLNMDSNEGLIMDFRETEPYFRALKRPEGTWFRISTSTSPSLGSLLLRHDNGNGEYYPEPGIKPYQITFLLDLLLRIMFSYSAPKHSLLLIHSSVVALNGQAVLFLGTSGTGKSTHSRLWLENIPGAELVNDDNPLLSLEQGGLYAYGTPWSGKTPCYRNVRVPVKAIVSLEQAPENKICRLSGIRAYANFSGAVSLVRWERSLMDTSTRMASDIAMSVPFYSMGCLPDADAAKLCHSTIFG